MKYEMSTEYILIISLSIENIRIYIENTRILENILIFNKKKM